MLVGFVHVPMFVRVGVLHNSWVQPESTVVGRAVCLWAYVVATCRSLMLR